MTKDKTTSIVTVITVVYNGENCIEKTILNVIEKSFPGLEYIIIDGGSNDGTLDIIKKYSDKINYFISEKDDGIYDAMNKGMHSASGEWLNFLNAGDTLDFDLNFLNQYNPSITPFLYGNATVVDAYGRISYVSGREINKTDLIKSMPICHQAIFYSRNFIRPYDLRYKIIADRVMTYSLIDTIYKPIYDARISIKYLEGGMSYNNYNKRVRDEILFMRNINKENLWNIISCCFVVYIKSSIYNTIKKNRILNYLYSKLK